MAIHRMQSFEGRRPPAEVLSFFCEMYFDICHPSLALRVITYVTGSGFASLLHGDFFDQLWEVTLSSRRIRDKRVCHHLRREELKIDTEVRLRAARCTGFLSQGRARLRAFLRCCGGENMQLSPYLIQKPCTEKKIMYHKLF